MSTDAGTILGRYEIRSPIGAGGMGEVYLARDTRLDRPVALKLLSGEVTRQEDRLHRFEQEARAASALNHPNILTIYEIGHADAGHFIATEYIDGETLRQHITRTHIRTAEALDIATQVCAALAAAHTAGIIHRDIKPENIMLRRDGYVKVLDFGLVKLTEQQVVDSEAPTKSPVKTNPRTVMGTVAYMSPEQVRGVGVDARTDIWSLGVVLYEMVAGRVPFEGATSSDVIVSILEKEPVPLARYAADVPTELEWIVKKTLAKDREERYQTIKDLTVDLRRLRQELEFKSKLGRSMPSGEEMSYTPSGGQAAATANVPASHTRDGGTNRTASSAEYLIGEIKRHRGSATLILSALLLVLAAASFGVYYFFMPGHPLAPFQNMSISRLTNTGRANGAAISPDGKYVVHVVSEAGQQSLWIRQVATSSNMQIVPPAEVQYSGLTFSRDGNFVYYVMTEKTPPAGLYQVPVLGGAPKKLVENVESSVALSSDGKRLAFMRWYPAEEEIALFVANVDGSKERKLATRKHPDYLTDVSWSPDDKIIATPVKTHDANGYYMSITGVRVEDGAEIPITTQRWPSVGRAEWVRDGTGLVTTAVDQTSRLSQVWYLSYPGGEAHRITNDLNDYKTISMTADSSALVTVQKDFLSNIWIADGDGNAGQANQITSSKYNGLSGLSWTPDGKIVYTSNASGNPDIWIMDADGSHQKQLTANAGANSYPSVTADGRYVVFVSDRTGMTVIWRMNIDGSNLKQLAEGKVYNPSCSSDSRWVVYEKYDSSKWTLWKVSIEGGNAERLTDQDAEYPAVSPDGKSIAYLYTDEQANSQRKIVVVPFQGGQPTRTFDIPPTARGVIQWQGGGRALTYVDNHSGVSNIWRQPLDGSPPKQLTDFKTDQIFFFGWSRDGQQLAVSRGMMITDVVLISDLK